MGVNLFLDVCEQESKESTNIKRYNHENYDLEYLIEYIKTTNSPYRISDFYPQRMDLMDWLVSNCQNYETVVGTSLPYFSLNSCKFLKQDYKKIKKLFSSVYLFDYKVVNLDLLFSKYNTYMSVEEYCGWKFKLIYDISRFLHKDVVKPSIVNFYFVYDKEDGKFYTDFYYVLSYDLFLVVNMLLGFMPSLRNK